MRIRTRTMVIATSKALQQAAAIVPGIILARIISKEDIGTYKQVFLVYNVVAGLFSYQLGNSMYYFVPRLPTERHRSLLSQTFVGTAVRGMIVVVLMLAGASAISGGFRNPRMQEPLYAMAFYVFGDSLAELIPAFMISLDRVVRAGVYSLIAAIARASAIVAAFAFGYSITMVVSVVVVAQTAIMLVGCADMVLLTHGGRWRLDRLLMREQWQYSWPLWPATAVGTLNFCFDKLVVSRVFDPGMYAIYAFGAMELPVIALVTTSMDAAIMPTLVTLASEGRNGEALSVWQAGARKCSLLVFPSFAFFMALMYGQGFVQAAWPFRVYMLMLPVRVAIFSALFRAFGQTRSIALAAGLLLGSNITLSLLLSWLFRGSPVAFVAPSIAVVGATLITVAFYLFRLCRILNSSFRSIMRWRELGQVMAASLAAGAFILFLPIPALPLVAKLPIQAMVFGLVFLGIMVWRKLLQSDEIELLSLPFRWARKVVAGGDHGSKT